MSVFGRKNLPVICQFRLPQQHVLLTVCALILSYLSGCAGEYVHDTYGVEAYEGFNEPRCVLVGRKSGTVVIDADAFHFQPGEKDLFYTNFIQPQPRSARSPRPTFRRFIVTDAANIMRHIQYDKEFSKGRPNRKGEPYNEIEVDVRKKGVDLFFAPWQVIPNEFEAPSATDAQLALLLPDGYEEYPWGTRIPWVADNGKTYMLKLVIEEPLGCRTYRSPTTQRQIAFLTPVAIIFDVVTFPVQAVGAIASIAIFGI